ncbi:response regulator [candidate division KSB1 bacterium]|nr:response regulator [candidate division KSB1 bacterium]
MKLLIVDDENTIRKALRFSMQKESHEIVEAENPVEALDKIAEQDFDLLILDFNLPVFSGLELIKMLNERGKDIPIILLTSREIKINKSLFSQKNPIKIINKDLPLQIILHNINLLLEQTITTGNFS